LLNGADFHFFEKRVGQIESCSHGQSVARKCENVKMRLCQLSNQLDAGFDCHSFTFC
jgi:hypothetical protein